MLICWTTSTNFLYSQTTTIENSKLRDAAKLIEKGKICEERVALLNERINFLMQRISIKDSIISIHGQKDTAQNKIQETYIAEVKNLTEQRDLASKEMLHQNKLLKRQKRKTTFAIVGTAALGVAAFIFLK